MHFSAQTTPMKPPKPVRNHSWSDSLTCLQANFHKKKWIYIKPNVFHVKPWFPMSHILPFRGLENSKIYKKSISVCTSLWRPQKYWKHLPKSSPGGLPGSPGGSRKSTKNRSGPSWDPLAPLPDALETPPGSIFNKFWTPSGLPFYWFSGFFLCKNTYMALVPPNVS